MVCREKIFNVATFILHSILCFIAIIHFLSRHSSSVSSEILLIVCHDKAVKCRDKLLLPFVLFFVATKLSNVVTNFFCLLHIICRDKAVKCCNKGSTVSLRTLLNICRDKAPFVAIFLLLFSLSFAVTKLKFVMAFSISCLSKFYFYSC